MHKIGERNPRRQEINVAWSFDKNWGRETGKECVGGETDCNEQKRKTKANIYQLKVFYRWNENVEGAKEMTKDRKMWRNFMKRCK